MSLFGGVSQGVAGYGRVLQGVVGYRRVSRGLAGRSNSAAQTAQPKHSNCVAIGLKGLMV